MKKVVKLRLEIRRNLGLLCFVVGCISAFIRVDSDIRFQVSLWSFIGAFVLYFSSGISKFVFKNRIIKIEAGEKKEDIHYQQFSTVALNSSKDLSLLNSAGDRVFSVSLKGVSQKQINQLLMNFEELGKTIKYNGKLNKKMVLKFKLSIGVKIILSVCCFVLMFGLIILLLSDPRALFIYLPVLLIFGGVVFFIPRDKFTLSPDSFIFRSEGTTKQVNLSDVSKALLSNEKLLLLYDTTNQNEVSYTFDLKKLKNENIQIFLNYLQTNVPVYVEEEIQKRGKFVLYEQPTQINTNAVETMSTQNNVQQSRNGRRRVVSNSNSPSRKKNNTSHSFTNDNGPSRRLEL